MEKVSISGIWIDEEKQIRVDFDNDRHFAVTVKQPMGRDEVDFALCKMARLIRCDEGLGK